MRQVLIRSDGAGVGTQIEVDGEPVLDAVSVCFEARAGEAAKLVVTKADGTMIGWLDVGETAIAPTVTNA